MSRIINAFLRNTTMQRKVFILFIVFTLLPIVISMVIVYFEFSELMNQNLLKIASKSHMQTEHMLASRVQSMLDNMDIIMLDKRTQSQINDLVVAQTEIPDQVKDYTEMKSLLLALEHNKNIFRISLYIPREKIFSHENINYKSIDQILTEPWYLELVREPSKTLYRLQDTYTDNEAAVRTLSVSRLLKNPYDYSQHIAVLKIDTKYDEIIGILNTASKVTNSCVVYLRDDANNVIGSGSESDCGHIRGLERADGEWRKAYLGETPGFVSELPVSNADWTLGYFIPEKDITLARQFAIARVLIFMVLVILLVSFVARVIARQSGRRVAVITQYMRRIETGDLKVTIENMGRDEIGILAENLNSMIRRLEESLRKKSILDREIKEAEIRATKAELRVFQSQINPHFLYNTLDLINWHAICNDIPELEKLVYALSQFYKKGLGKGEDIVRIESEAAHIESYIEIQNMRLDNSVSFAVDLKEVFRYHIPRVTLQPLIENAVIHGILEKKDQKGHISIRGRRRGENVEIVVEDDGRGMTAEETARLNDMCMADRAGGIGIKNVNERIQLYFGPQYGLRFESAQGKGTRVSVILPAKL